MSNNLNYTKISQEFINFINDKIKTMLNSYDKQITLKQGMFKHLPNHNFLIQIKSDNLEDNLEFARIASTAIEDLLIANTIIKTNNKYASIDITIPGTKKECYESISDLNKALANEFNKLTNSNINIKTFANKKSSYKALDIKTAEINYKKFQHKMAGKL